MGIEKVRLAPSGPETTVLTPSSADPPDPSKYLSETGEYTTPASGGSQSLAQTLLIGNESGGTDLAISSGDKLITNLILPHDASEAHQFLMVGGATLPGVFQQGIMAIGSNTETLSIGASVTINGGSPSAGGNLDLNAGSAFADDGVEGGNVNIEGGQRRNIPNGGNVNIKAGTSLGTAPNAAVTLQNGASQRGLVVDDLSNVDAASVGDVAVLSANKTISYMSLVDLKAALALLP